jgi:hypothetical protein
MIESEEKLIQRSASMIQQRLASNWKYLALSLHGILVRWLDNL